MPTRFSISTSPISSISNSYRVFFYGLVLDFEPYTAQKTFMLSRFHIRSPGVVAISLSTYGAPRRWIGNSPAILLCK